MTIAYDGPIEVDYQIKAVAFRIPRFVKLNGGLLTAVKYSKNIVIVLSHIINFIFLLRKLIF